MTNQQQWRKLAADLGICDDRCEKMFTDMMQKHQTEVELERARVPDKVWELEIQLMKERMS